MKKWTVLGIVALAAALLFLQYMMEKKKDAAQSGAMPPAEQQVGVALPSGATDYVARQEENAMPPASGSAVYGGIVLPTVQSAYKGACDGGGLREMLASHDKYWGFFAWDTSFTQSETQRMYGYVSDYVACQAAARSDVSLCDSLPGPAERGGFKVTPDMAPYMACRKKTINLLFEAYLAGNIKGDSYCRLGLSGWDTTDLERFSVPEFCSVLAKGAENAEPFLLKAFAPAPDDASAKIAMDFPLKEKDCKSKQECLDKYRLYKAVKNGRPQDCPKDYVPHCKALADHATTSCEPILKEMSQFYCSTVKRVEKVTGGYIGVTKEEIAADIEKNKAAKAEADTMKKEQEKQQAIVNKRVKEMLKKN